MSKGARVTLIIVVLFVAFVAAVVVVAPKLFDVNRYRPQVISLLEQQTGRPVEIGHLTLSVFPVVSIQVDRLSIGNPPGFAPGNWLSIQQVHALLDSRALWHRQIVIRSLDLDKPVLSLQSDTHGKWNTQFTPVTPVTAVPPVIAAAKLNQPGNDPPEPQAQPLFSVREISKLTIEHGALTMVEEAQAGQPAPPGLQITGIAGRVGNIALKGLFGQAGESPSHSAARRPPGFLPAGATGKLTAEELSFGKLRATGLQAAIQTSPAQVLLNPVELKLYDGKTTAKITIQLNGPTAAYQIQASFGGINTSKLLVQFPGLRDAVTGTLQGRLTLSGTSSPSPRPWQGKQGEGGLEIRNGRWPKLKMNPTLVQLARIAQLGPASGDLSSFSSVTATWRLANEMLTTPSIQIAGSGITGSGSGTVDLRQDGLLNYQGIGHIPAHASALTNVLAGLSGSTLRGNELSISFAVRGTLAKPVFELKPNYQAPSSQQGPSKNQNQTPQVLQNLFKMFQKRKP